MKQDVKMAIMKKAQEVSNTSVNEEIFPYEDKLIKVSKPTGANGKRTVKVANVKHGNDANFIRLGYISNDCIHILI